MATVIGKVETQHENMIVSIFVGHNFGDRNDRRMKIWGFFQQSQRFVSEIKLQWLFKPILIYLISLLAEIGT